MRPDLVGKKPARESASRGGRPETSLRPLSPDPATRHVTELWRSDTHALWKPSFGPLHPDAVGIPDQIDALVKLRDAGVLTEDEFQEKKRDLLARM